MNRDDKEKVYWNKIRDEGIDNWKEFEKRVNMCSKQSIKRYDPMHGTLKRLVFHHIYPRLDINVTKQMNHLLKSPFCVHPKTGRVCVPIDPETCDDFDPRTVPSLSQLIKQINENPPDTKVRDIKTDLTPYLSYFRDFVGNPVEDEKKIQNGKEMDIEDISTKMEVS